ncbi:hypothetical protein K0M31_018891 [Melipona bicolor]|uniref:Uncharacterized protein n=1 Tax=Melipona bicolor TaxID=60889 RepID=A0AA40G4A1_9HYME|nr:hypothetical protein K0M31_018891 [Melipona bicolor]
MGLNLKNRRNENLSGRVRNDLEEPSTPPNSRKPRRRVWRVKQSSRWLETLPLARKGASRRGWRARNPTPSPINLELIYDDYDDDDDDGGGESNARRFLNTG